ncbi:CoF synthetase [Pricia sp. S334]|uniref:CoF synthetase n=1 Tax=Pricia mediterranea TaxID=3076079 RepID=A0ABU3L3T2_9FLAO|nr:CoF synthetase [Pricia sp. S334]MDT7828411.1 CoF synthetase [Pricia sp. S334]
MPLNLRKSIFWLRDRLKGAPIKKHYKDIKRLNANHGSEHSIQKRRQHLDKILQHCCDTVPYFRNLGIKEMRLDRFPVTNKNLIRDNREDFLSDAYLDQENHKVTTSGSTGTPFTVVQDVDKRERHTADVHFFWEAVGHPWGTRFYYLKIWNDRNEKSKLVQELQNIVPVDAFKLDDDRIRQLLEDIRSDSGPKSILGYASALDSIVKYLNRRPTDMGDANVISIIAMSETLDEPTKKALEINFDCPVASRYANMENGMLAQHTLDTPEEFLVNSASYRMEILDLEKDIPAQEGELGRIVVTDLFNRAMPMIRYDTGDYGVMALSGDNGKKLHVLQQIEGRKMDAIFDTKGEHVSSFIITNSMWKYTELKQYQFIQVSGKEYEFKLNSDGRFERETELLDEFRGYLGKDAKISVAYVDDIPLLSSGKRKKVLNRSRRV